MGAAPGGVPHALGKYRFVATLGHGGMAEVFLAVAMGPAGFHKLQVVKRLRPHLAEDPDLCAMFLDEARLAARLNHRNVVQTNEVDRVDGQYFMAMEYLDGQPLHRVIVQARKVRRALSPALISRVLCDALAGLHYAHELADYDGAPLGVVHRDVSPQNVFVTYDGQVKIVDFGIAKAARRAVETATGVIKGKVSYMAPEQAFGDVDRRADVFSVGVVLWELLADRRLWLDMGDPEILTALVHAVPRLQDHRPDVDPELARICDRALALDRDERYPTAAALRADLERAAPPCAAEALGAFVEALFHEQRQSIKEALARQVDLVEQGADGDLLELERSDRPSIRPPGPRLASWRAARERSATARQPLPPGPPPSASRPRARRPRPPPRSTVRLVPAPPPSSRSRRLPPAVLASPPEPHLAGAGHAPAGFVAGAYVLARRWTAPPPRRAPRPCPPRSIRAPGPPPSSPPAPRRRAPTSSSTSAPAPPRPRSSSTGRRCPPTPSTASS